ncbi:hypothetical protein [Petrachloros mirabilis]
MTCEEQITKMTAAIKQAIKVMGDRFGSTEQDVIRAIEGLKASMQASTDAGPSMKAQTQRGGPLLQNQDATAGT